MPSTLFADLEQALQQIATANGYSQTLTGVWSAPRAVPDGQPLPYALLRPTERNPASAADRQAMQTLTIEVELVMSRTATADALLDAERDVLIALGYLADDELESSWMLPVELQATTYNLPAGGIKTSGITLTLGIASPVTY